VSFLNKVLGGVKNERDRDKEIRLINHVSFAVRLLINFYNCGINNKTTKTKTSKQALNEQLTFAVFS